MFSHPSPWFCCLPKWTCNMLHIKLNMRSDAHIFCIKLRDFFPYIVINKNLIKVCASATMTTFLPRFISAHCQLNLTTITFLSRLTYLCLRLIPSLNLPAIFFLWIKLVHVNHPLIYRSQGSKKINIYLWRLPLVTKKTRGWHYVLAVYVVPTPYCARLGIALVTWTARNIRPFGL